VCRALLLAVLSSIYTQAAENWSSEYSCLQPAYSARLWEYGYYLSELLVCASGERHLSPGTSEDYLLKLQSPQEPDPGLSCAF